MPQQSNHKKNTASLPMQYSKAGAWFLPGLFFISLGCLLPFPLLATALTEIGIILATTLPVLYLHNLEERKESNFLILALLALIPGALMLGGSFMLTGTASTMTAKMGITLLTTIPLILAKHSFKKAIGYVASKTLSTDLVIDKVKRHILAGVLHSQLAGDLAINQRFMTRIENIEGFGALENIASIQAYGTSNFKQS